MAHDPTRHWPLGVGPENTSIPGAAWLEMLGGQVFPVVGAGAMVWNGTMWVPVSDQNRLPVEATLSGRNVQVVSPRGIYDGDDTNHVFKAPIGATGFSVHATIYGVTGTFDPGEGLGVRLFLLSGDVYRTARTLAEINSPRVSSGEGNVLIYVGPYDIDETMLHSRVLAHKLINTGMFYPYLRLDLMVNGTFGAGEGFDCEMLLVWHY